MNFVEKLASIVRRNRSRLCVGLDPDPELMPAGIGGWTRLTAGIGWIPENVNLYMLTRPFDQTAIMKGFDRNGALNGVSFAHIFTIDQQKIFFPKITNISLGLEQKLPKNLNVQLNFLRKRESNGFFFDLDQTLTKERADKEQDPGIFPLVFQLKNGKTLTYDAAEIAVSKQLTFKNDSYDLFASYSRSSARSNAAGEYGLDTPVRYSHIAGRLGYDIPNRFVSWGIFETERLRGILLSYHLEYRDGLLYTISNDEGAQVGEFNGQRMPSYFSLNVRLGKNFSRTLGASRYKFQVRVSVENITNNDNATLINSNISSLAFMTLYGKYPRHYVFGIKFRGREKK
mgnify:FL=1